MLSIVRPTTYHANLQAVGSDFYDFQDQTDEAFAPMIAKSIKTLLRQAPFLAETRFSSRASLHRNQSYEHPSNDSLTRTRTAPLLPVSNSVGKLFHSDSSLSSSNCSSASSSPSSSPFSSNSSLTECKKRKKKMANNGNVEVILPDDMLTRLVRDIIRSAEGEPSGIRGCQLFIELAENALGCVLPVGKINCDPKILPSCQLRVQLHTIPPPPEAHGSQVLLNRLLGTPSHVIYIKPGYMIEKKKFVS